MTDALDALFNEDKSDTPVTTPEVTQDSGQPRDEAGRFAPKAAETPAEPVAEAPQPEPVAATPPAQQPAPEPVKAEPGHIPIAALLDEREKRKEERERREAAERRLAELESKQQQALAPSIQDPENYQAWVNDQFARIETGTRFNLSEALARREHGDETVTAAMEWGQQRAKASPAFAAEFVGQQFPIDWVVRQHKRDKLLSDIGEDPEAYRARVIAEWQAANSATPAPQPAAPSQPTAPKAPAPRPSLAHATSAGGIQTVPQVAPFEAVFPK